MGENNINAIDNMKRIDTLTAEIKRNHNKIADLSADLATLRKKSGKFNSQEKQSEIAKINFEKSSLENTNKQNKAQIKVLQKQVVDFFISAYPIAKEEDKKAIKNAVAHATNGRLKLVDGVDAGGVLGDTDIVEAVITHDRAKKRKIVCLKKAGVKNEVGRVVIRPQISVYLYDTNQTEGEVIPADNSLKDVLKKQRQCVLPKIIKQAYKVGAISPLFIILGVMLAKGFDMLVSSGEEIALVCSAFIYIPLFLINLACVVLPFIKKDFVKRTYAFYFVCISFFIVLATVRTAIKWQVIINAVTVIISTVAFIIFLYKDTKNERLDS